MAVFFLAAAFLGAAFLADFLAAAFFGAAFLALFLATFFAGAFLVALFLAAFLGAAFLALFLVAAFLGAAFLVAAFFLVATVRPPLIGERCNPSSHPDHKHQMQDLDPPSPKPNFPGCLTGDAASLCNPVPTTRQILNEALVCCTENEKKCNTFSTPRAT